MKKPAVADVAKLLRRLATREARGEAGDLDPRLLAGLVARGLVAEDGGRRPVLTEVGRMFLRRHLAGADGFAAQHQTRAEAAVDDPVLGRQTVKVNLDESPLARLRRLRGGDGNPVIDAAEFAAGERLRSDYSRGRIMPRVTANWSAAVADNRRDGGAGGIADLTASALAARQLVDKALAAVGPDFAGLLVDFCCFLKGIEEIERDRRWPARSAKLVVRLALAALARHYGLAAKAEGGPARMRHWGAEDYRPTIGSG